MKTTMAIFPLGSLDSNPAMDFNPFILGTRKVNG
jgi:hypothetical protein